MFFWRVLVERGDGIEVVEEGEGVRIVMPAFKPEIDLRSPRLLWRVGAWLQLLFGFFMVVGTVWLTGDTWTHVRKFLPLANLVDALLFLVGIFQMSFVLGGGFGLGWLVLVGLFRGRLDFIVRGGEVIHRYRCGPWRRTWRERAAGIDAIVVKVPRTISFTELSKPVEERRADLWFELSGGKFRRISRPYPHRLMAQLANELSQRLCLGDRALRATGERRMSSGEMKVLDEASPAFWNEDVGGPVEGSGYVLCEAGKGICIRTEHGLNVGKLVQTPMFRAGLWCVLIPLGVLLATMWISDPTGMVWTAAKLVLAAQGGPGVLIMACFIWEQVSWVEYEVTPHFLVKTGRLFWFRWRRRWPRGEIAALRLAQRIGDEGASRMVVELVKNNGKRVVISGGRLLSLRLLATVLRRELGVGTDGGKARLSPVDREWHYQDEEEPPKEKRFDVVFGEHELVASKIRKRWGRTETVAAVFGGLFCVGSVLVPMIALPQVKKADDVEAVWMSSIILGLLGLLVGFVILYDAVDRWVIVATKGEITVSRRTLFGKGGGRWARENVRSLRTEAIFKGNPATSVWVVLVTDAGVERMVSGKAESHRYLATVLRQFLGVPAEEGEGRAGEGG